MLRDSRLPLLRSELHASDVASSDLRSRVEIADQLALLPNEAFSRLKYFQPQVGCFNRCAFCSQHAGQNVWQFTRRGLRNFVAALAYVARARVSSIGPSLGAARNDDYPGVLYAYLDNDVASYVHLDEYLHLLVSELNSPVRLSTVGYSARNDTLQAMHERIAAEHGSAIHGIRFSLTPFTVGWTLKAQRQGQSTQCGYVSDFANTLRTYRRVVTALRGRRSGARVEIRFSPLVATFREPLGDAVIKGHHVLHIGPHLAVSAVESPAPPASGQRSDGSPYYLITSDVDLQCGAWGRVAATFIDGLYDPMVLSGGAAVRRVLVARSTNSLGHFYVATPDRVAHGETRVLHLFPSGSRPASGYFDGSKPFLNALLAVKARHGISSRSSFDAANDADVAAVLHQLADESRRLARSDRRASEYVSRDILPMVEAYADALREAGYPPGAFFDPQFTIDTGPIVNQGRALRLFKGLTMSEDDPLTPHEQARFGPSSFTARRGRIWRIAPSPFLNSRGQVLGIGGKNVPGPPMTIGIEELDASALRSVDPEHDCALRRFEIRGAELEYVPLRDAFGQRLFPGATGTLGPGRRLSPHM